MAAVHVLQMRTRKALKLSKMLNGGSNAWQLGLRLRCCCHCCCCLGWQINIYHAPRDTHLSPIRPVHKNKSNRSASGCVFEFRFRYEIRLELPVGGKGREGRGGRGRRLIHQGVESTDLLPSVSVPLPSATGRQRGKPLPRFDLGPARSLAPGMASVSVNTTCHNMSSPLWCPVVCHCPSVPVSHCPVILSPLRLSL